MASFSGMPSKIHVWVSYHTSKFCRSGSRKQQCCSGSCSSSRASVPGELDLVVQRAELLWQAGKKEVAADSIQQVLATEPTFGAALNLQLAIQHDNGDEAGFMETFSKSLGDTIPTTSQLNALYRAGELHFTDRDYEEARKHWAFCANRCGFSEQLFSGTWHVQGSRGRDVVPIQTKIGRMRLQPSLQCWTIRHCTL